MEGGASNWECASQRPAADTPHLASRFYRYWEGVENFKRLCLSSLIVLLGAPSAAQNTLAILVCFVVLVIQANRRPYRRPIVDNLALACNLSIFLMLVITMATSEGNDFAGTLASSDVLILVAASVPLLLIGALMMVCGVEAGRAAAERRTKMTGVSSAAAGWSAAAAAGAPTPPPEYEAGWDASSRRTTAQHGRRTTAQTLGRQTSERRTTGLSRQTSDRRTTFQLRPSCAHFGARQTPAERRTDAPSPSPRPFERKTTAISLKEGKGRSVSDI